MVQKLVFLPRLESLRGLAAVSVVGYHASGQFTDTYVTGMAPVVLFFVLSGFVLARSLARNDDIIEFLRHRIFRLFPAAIATVLLLTALHEAFGFYHGFEPDFSPLNVILNALMIKHDINGPMWSMTVECFATPVIILSFLAGRRFGPRSLIPLIAILFGLSFVGPYAHLLGGYANLAPLHAFVLGVALHFSGRGLVEAIGGRQMAAAIVACILFFYCGLQKQTAPIIFLEACSSGLLIALIAFGAPQRGFRFLDQPVIGFYGRISFSFYLLHMIGLSIAVRISSIAGWPMLSILLSTVLGVLLTTPMAWMSWRFIEKPFIAMGKKWRDPRRGAVTTT
ncbi:exopolysaccharide production protein ExoZ [Bradyrhizobium sp. F1.4.3]|uniref:acyltransferase family protein n=1 Tax=Bradyrhizobium sp. F1.4.3 TaxID=3156356 RepID=UPI0033993B5A